MTGGADANATQRQACEAGKSNGINMLVTSQPPSRETPDPGDRLRPLGLGREHCAIRALLRAQDLGLAQHDRQLLRHRLGSQALPQLLDGCDVHGLEGFFIVLIVAVLAGWYP
jgi:hypothetical protein